VSRSKRSVRGYVRERTANEGSTDGSTHARKVEGGQWVDVDKPMLYLFDRGEGVEMNGDVATDGGAPEVALFGLSSRSLLRRPHDKVRATQELFGAE
jgi:hypothetical protein